MILLLNSACSLRWDEKQESRRDWVRASYLGMLIFVFVGVIAFACYANQFDDWTKAKDLLAVILPALPPSSVQERRFILKIPGVEPGLLSIPPVHLDGLLRLSTRPCAGFLFRKGLPWTQQ